MRARLLTLPLGLLLLAGCGSDPQAEVREDVRAVLAAANDEDADRVRTAVDDLLATLREQVGSGELTTAEAAAVGDAAEAVRDRVTLLEEVEQTPTPTPTPEQSASPSPTPPPEPPEEPEPTQPPVTEVPEEPEEPEEPAETPEPEEPEPQEPEETEEPEEPVEPEEPEEPEQAPQPEGDGEDQATVVPQLPAVTPTPTP